MDIIKFAMKATIIRYLRNRHNRAIELQTMQASQGVPITRTQSRAASIHDPGRG